jgi:hypothetical protein
MKIIVPCKGCFDELRQSWGNNRYEIDINDQGFYTFTCKEGHINTFVLGNPKFEVLYESGLYALADNYYREASTSFYVAFERFLEFMLFAKMVSTGMVDSMESFITAYFKFMNSQSERQVGAFYALFYPHSAVLNGPIFKKKIVEARNNIIHKGYIPSQDETIEFGENIKLIIDQIWDSFVNEGGNMAKALVLYKEHLIHTNKTEQTYAQTFYLNKHTLHSVIARKTPSIREYATGLRAEKRIIVGLPMEEADWENLKKVY